MTAYTELPNSTVKISKITFGAWAIGGWLWGGSDEKEALAALDAAIEIGMSSIDTAPVYGFGKSEELVGRSISGKRDKVQILTKFGLCWDKKSGHLHAKTKDDKGVELDLYRNGSKQSIFKECEDSLKRLGTDYLDYYQIHWPDESHAISETMEALSVLKQQGKILAGGVCNYSLSDFKKAIEYFPVSCNQVPYSMLERGIEKDLLPWCRDNAPKVIAYSPLQRGFLTGKIRQGHAFAEGDHRATSKYVTSGMLDHINSFVDTILHPLAEKKECSVSQVVLRWTLEQPGVCCVLAGARNTLQVMENWGALSLTLTDEEMNIIARGLDVLHENLGGQ